MMRPLPLAVVVILEVYVATGNFLPVGKFVNCIKRLKLTFYCNIKGTSLNVYWIWILCKTHKIISIANIKNWIQIKMIARFLMTDRSIEITGETGFVSLALVMNFICSAICINLLLQCDVAFRMILLLFFDNKINSHVKCVDAI